MSVVKTIHKYQMKDTDEQLCEFEYTGIDDIDAVWSFTKLPPHDLYNVNNDPHRVGCIITTNTGNDLRIVPGNLVVKRDNGNIEIWDKMNPPIPFSSMRLLTKENLLA